ERSADHRQRPAAVDEGTDTDRLVNLWADSQFAGSRRRRRGRASLRGREGRNHRQEAAFAKQVATAPIAQYGLHGIKHAFLPECGLMIPHPAMTLGLRFGHPTQAYSRFDKLAAPVKRTYILLVCVAVSLSSVSAQATAPGKRPFEDRCAGCHGAD